MDRMIYLSMSGAKAPMQRQDVLAPGDLLLAPVQRLVLEDEHRVLVPDRGGEQPERLGRRSR